MCKLLLRGGHCFIFIPKHQIIFKQCPPHRHALWPAEALIIFCLHGIQTLIDKLEADLAKAMLSLPATKGFEIGSGFAAVRMTGREHNDPFVVGTDRRPLTTTNHSGGIQGGITNGEDVVIRVAFKPTATISSEQQTVTRSGEATTVAAKGRHDPCLLPRFVPMGEAMVAIVLADHWLRWKGQCGDSE